jgi:hypothetical protein
MRITRRDLMQATAATALAGFVGDAGRWRQDVSR